MAARLTAYLVVAIVAVTFIAGLMVGAQRDDNDGPVDLIVRNASVYTADRRGTVAEAVAIRGNQILRVGSNRDIARLQRPQTIVVDARGGAVLPGFNDAHIDLIGGGLRLAMADLTGAASSAEVLDRIRAWSTANPGTGWVVASGWSPDQFKNGLPTRQLLDSVIKDRPALVYAADEGDRLVWVNSRALRLAGITRKTPDPADGAIIREGRGGDPSGVLRGAVASGAAALIPPPSRDQRVEALRAAVAEANLHGITSAQNTAASCERNLDLFDEARREGDLTLRVYCSVAVDPHAVAREADLAPYEDIRKRYPDDPLFKVGALSFIVDGTLPARSAALLEPYAGSEETGDVLVDPDELNRAVRLADAAGWQIITHATGDRAVRMALTAYAHASRSNRLPSKGRRHRLEHLALVDTADLPRLGPLGVTASLQPSMMPSDEISFDGLSKSIGPTRAEESFPLAKLAAQTRLLLGSAWPAHTLDPIAVLQRATSVFTPLAEPDEPPAAALKLKPAVDAYTSTGAWGSFDDQRKGSIAPGMLADLVVLSADVIESPETLATASVEVTIFDGKIVHRAGRHVLTAPDPSLQH
ncbi:MAG TPA: amidohydrolase [Vicinamibacterales bacterium]|nr:amidohydrolase [Vicinamibacterales bacterium]